MCVLPGSRADVHNMRAVLRRPDRWLRGRASVQVYTAEEKAALAMFNAEEARKKEQTLMDEMRKLVGQVTGQEET